MKGWVKLIHPEKTALKKPGLIRINGSHFVMLLANSKFAIIFYRLNSFNISFFVNDRSSMTM